MEEEKGDGKQEGIAWGMKPWDGMEKGMVCVCVCAPHCCHPKVTCSMLSMALVFSRQLPLQTGSPLVTVAMAGVPGASRGVLPLIVCMAKNNPHPSAEPEGTTSLLKGEGGSIKVDIGSHPRQTMPSANYIFIW